MICSECKANIDGKCKINQYQHKLKSGYIGCRMHRTTIEWKIDEKKSIISLLR